MLQLILTYSMIAFCIGPHKLRQNILSKANYYVQDRSTIESGGIEGFGRRFSHAEVPATHLVLLEYLFWCEKMFKAVKSIPASECSGRWPLTLKMYNTRTLLVVDCEVSSILKAKSAIQLRQFEVDVFPVWLVRARGLVGYHYTLLVHSDLCQQNRLNKTHGEELMELTTEQF